MYVCVCNAVTERQVREHLAAQPGARLRDLRDSLGLASGCGQCCAHAQEILREGVRSCAEQCPVAA